MFSASQRGYSVTWSVCTQVCQKTPPSCVLTGRRPLWKQRAASAERHWGSSAEWRPKTSTTSRRTQTTWTCWWRSTRCYIKAFELMRWESRCYLFWPSDFRSTSALRRWTASFRLLPTAQRSPARTEVRETAERACTKRKPGSDPLWAGTEAGCSPEPWGLVCGALGRHRVPVNCLFWVLTKAFSSGF